MKKALFINRKLFFVFVACCFIHNISQATIGFVSFITSETFTNTGKKYITEYPKVLLTGTASNAFAAGLAAPTCPTTNANVDQTICAGSTVTLAGSIGGNASSGTWSGGTGTFLPNATTLNATYTPSAAEKTAGTVTLTLTTDDPPGVCIAATDQMVITINPAATANANVDQTICAGSTVTLAGSKGGSAASATWSGGAGIFSPNANTLNATYTPSAGEVTAGTVTLTLTTNDPAGPCGAVSDQMVITINPVATVGANVDQTICASSTILLAGSIGGGASSATWSGGTGTFSPNPTTLNATYTPSTGDKTAGTVTLTLTTNDPAGPCGAVSDQMIITINPVATADAGTDYTICAGSTVTLAGSIGGSASSGTWSGGTGTFSPNANALNATYTPSAGEVTAGTVTLTLTTNDPAGPCGAVSDQMVITINPVATANANVDQTICAGSTVTLAGSIGGGASGATWSGGTGTFSPNANTLNATYTPSAGEVTAGTLTLTLTTNDPRGPCPAVSDQMVITINPIATVDANVDQTICAGSTVTLAGSIGGSASSGTWSGGTGTFSPNANALNATYTPSVGEVTAGTLTLTLTTNDPAGPCGAVSDQMVITINPLATVDAGVDQTICASSTILLAGSIGGGASSATWSGGTGTFSPDANTLNATYIPSATELTGSSVTLTLTTNNPTGGQCAVASDQMVITIKVVATADANIDQTICAGSTVTLAGSIGGSASSGTWSGGTGIFSPDANTLNATYTPSAGEVTAGTVTLTLTTNDPAGPCGAVSDQMVITINPAAIVDAGVDQTICASSTVLLAGSIGGGASSATWSGGTGTFSPDANTLNATYIPSASELTGSSVTLTLTTNNPTGGQCAVASDQMVITIKVVATADAGIDQTICAGSTVTLAGSIGGSASSGTWSGGTGTFSPDANTLNATYTPSAGEITAGTLTLTLTTNDPAGPCGAVSDQMVITINPVATVDANVDQTICAGSTVTLAGSIGGSASSATWSGGTGTFSPDATTLNATYTPSAGEVTAGTLTLTLTTNDPVGPCAIVSDQMVITINPAVTVDLGNDTTISICTGSLILDAGNTGSNFLWNTTATTQTISVNASGTYYVTVTNGNCTGSDTIHVTVLPLSVDLGNDTILCAGGSIILDAGNTGSNFLWNTTATTQTISVNASGTYYVTVTKGNCTASDTIHVTVLPLLTVDLGKDTIITTCKNDSLLLDAGALGSSYLWSTGATTQTIYVSTTGTYYVKVTNAGGCTASDTIHVVIYNTLHVNFGPDTTVCGCILLNAYTSGATSYQWCSGGSNYTIKNVCVTGMYCVRVSNGVCTASDTINITVLQLPVVNLGNDTTITSSIILNAGNTGSSFSWNTGATTQTITVNTPDTYYVTVTNTLGCSSTDSIHIDVPVGIAGISKTHGLKIYPNPSKGTMQLEYFIPEEEQGEFLIFDVTGKKVFKNMLKGGYNQIILSTVDLVNGMYFYQLISNNKVFAQNKLIINK